MNIPMVTSLNSGRELPVTHFGDPLLQKPSVAVAKVDDAIRTLAADMLATMHLNNGIGLAGPQVGRNLRIVLIDIPLPDKGLSPTASPGERVLLPRMPLALINPEVIPVATAGVACSEEGCLSFPEIYGRIERPAAVVLRTHLLDGEFVEIECGGLLGRCLQHELDHLDGIVFVERMVAEDRAAVDGDLKRLRRRTWRILGNDRKRA